jgi:hypothetical protein
MALPKLDGTIPVPNDGLVRADGRYIQTVRESSLGFDYHGNCSFPKIPFDDLPRKCVRSSINLVGRVA